jgi:ribonuclease BN (tRNA processing enzyme)
MGLGYKFTEQGKTFVFLTDNELGHVHRGGRTFDDYAEFCLGADLLIHDAEYTDREYQTKTRQWGHSTYKEALALAMAAGVKRFGLFHHNQDRSDEQVDAIVAECRGILRDKGVDMECFGVSQTTELAL